MKKLLLFLLISYSSIGQYNEIKKDVKSTFNKTGTVLKNTGESVKNTIHSIDTSSVSKQMYSDVKTVIKAVASGLGIASEKVYTVITKKFFIEGVVGLLTNIILIIVYVFLIRFFKNLIKKTKEAEYSAPLSLLFVVFLIFSTIFLYHNLSNFPNNVGKVFNSEYYTIEFIFNNLKDLTK
jgi:hypothetical protein